jgi:16S rRNA (uracil1498-N3)-methyltransferase
VLELSDWLRRQSAPAADETRLLLSLAEGSRPLRQRLAEGRGALTVLNGPEGGLQAEEEAAAGPPAFSPPAWARACCAPRPRRWPCWRTGRGGDDDA